MSPWQLKYIFVVLYSRFDLTVTVQTKSSFPTHLQTNSSTCPSTKSIETVRRNVKCLVEQRIDNNNCICGGDCWTRVAYLNMSDPQQTCPSNWNLNTSPVRGCGRSSIASLLPDNMYGHL